MNKHKYNLEIHTQHTTIVLNTHKFKSFNIFDFHQSTLSSTSKEHISEKLKKYKKYSKATPTQSKECT